MTAFELDTGLASAHNLLTFMSDATSKIKMILGDHQNIRQHQQNERIRFMRKLDEYRTSSSNDYIIYPQTDGKTIKDFYPTPPTTPSSPAPSTTSNPNSPIGAAIEIERPVQVAGSRKRRSSANENQHARKIARDNNLTAKQQQQHAGYLTTAGLPTICLNNTTSPQHLTNVFCQQDVGIYQQNNNIYRQQQQNNDNYQRQQSCEFDDIADSSFLLTEVIPMTELRKYLV